MKPEDLKLKYIELRASGKSYSSIAKELQISKSTCTKWERELEAEIAKLKREELNTLYECYHMRKEARIKQLGDTLERVEDALQQADLEEVPPEKLLDFKLKYTEALQREYTPTEPAFTFNDRIGIKDIVGAFGDLLNRVRAGEVTTDQANRESMILSNLLKAYEVAEAKATLDTLEAIIGSR